MPDAWRRRSGSTTERGYGHAWRKLRAAILRRDRHLCQVCAGIGRITEAREVDHITPKARGGKDHPDNLRAICRACHATKTGREGSGRDPVTGCDPTGMPVDPTHHWHA